MSQNSGATYVSSFQGWKKMGYSVNKGQRGINILVPVNVTYLQSGPDEYVQLRHASDELKKHFHEGKVPSIQRTFYKIGNVFDISQTNMPVEEYPKYFSMGVPSEQHDNIIQGLVEYAQTELQCTVSTKDLSSISKRGYYNRQNNEIALSDKLQSTQKLSTLSHEIGHALIHNEVSDKSTSQKEFEADAISIMMDANFGVDTTTSRESHLASHFNAWKKDILEQNADKEVADQQMAVELAMQNSFSNVFSIYQNEIDKINAYTQKYLPKDMQLGQQKQTSFIAEAVQQAAQSNASHTKMDNQINIDMEEDIEK